MTTRKQRRPRAYNIYRELRIPEGSLPVVNDPDFVDLLHEWCAQRRPDTERGQRIAIWGALSQWQAARALQGDHEAWLRLEESRTWPDPAERDAREEAAWKHLLAWGRVEEYAAKGEHRALQAWMEWTGAMPPKRKTKHRQELDAMRERMREALGSRYHEPMFPPVNTRLDAWRETFIQQALLLHFRTGVEELAEKGIHVPVLN